MGSPPGPYLANGWLSQFDDNIKGDAKLNARYMDEIIISIKSAHIITNLSKINNLHPMLKFTIEYEVNGELPFIDMKLLNLN